MLHQFVKIKLKPPTVGLSLSYIEQRLYMYKGKKTKKNILKKFKNNLFIYSILCKTWMPNIRCYDLSSALLQIMRLIISLGDLSPDLMTHN